MPRMPLAGLSLALALALAGCTDEAEGPEVTRTIELEPAGRPGSTYEDNVSLSQGKPVVITLNASAEVDWNVHGHLRMGVHTFDAGRSASTTTTVVPPELAWFGVALSNPHEQRVSVLLTIDFR